MYFLFFFYIFDFYLFPETIILMKILVLDNFDSFTYNLVHYIEEIQKVEVDVFRNNEIELSEIGKYDKIVLSPGPGLPEQAGILKVLIKEYASTKSILGVCLGLQAIGEVFGAKLINLNKVYHGVASPVFQKEFDKYLFTDIPEVFEAGRYHSWIIDYNNIPDDLIVSSIDEENRIMSLFHSKYDVRGVQFHPESILTPLGKKMIENWLKY
jgi:anthranilate synthase component 2